MSLKLLINSISDCFFYELQYKKAQMCREFIQKSFLLENISIQFKICTCST